MTPVKYGARALQESPAKQFSRVLLMTAVTHGTPNRSKVDHDFWLLKELQFQRNQSAWPLLPTRLVFFKPRFFRRLSSSFFSTPGLPLGTSCAQMKAGKGYERIW